MIEYNGFRITNTLPAPLARGHVNKYLSLRVLSPVPAAWFAT